MFKPIGRIVTRKAPAGLARSVEAAIVLARATEYAAGQFTAIRYRNGRLTIVAPSIIGAQELVLRKTYIIDELNALLGEKVVRDLYIRS